MGRSSIGFTTQDHSTDGMEMVKKAFTPEFRNRLDGIIQFGSLDQRTIISVVDKFIVQLEAQLEEKKVSLNVDDSARELLAEKGFDVKMGARPMARVIQEYIKKPLADEILFGRLANGGEVHVLAQDGEIVLQFEEDLVES